MTTLTAFPYPGNAAQPWAPAGPGWRSCGHDVDPMARAFAQSGALAGLPLYHYTDAVLANGVHHRFFAFETPHGPVVGAYRYEGLGALGQSSQADCGPNEVFIPDIASPTGGGFCVPTDVPTPPAPNLPPPPAPPDTGGGPAPAPAPAPSGGAPTPQVTPPTDATCTHWTADATNDQATALANQIADGTGPVPWKDQSIFQTTIAGVRWSFTMNFGVLPTGGIGKFVVAWRCTGGSGSGSTPNAGTPSSGGSPSSSSSLAGVALAALALVGLGTGAVLATRRKRPA